MGQAIQQFNRREWTDETWNESWGYIKMVVDTAQNPFLILDEHLQILAANKLFYRSFRIDEKDAEPKYVNELGNGVWDIHTLGALLTGILPKNTFFNGIEINSEFPSIGKKVMLLNGKSFSPIILITTEDTIQTTLIVAELADYAFRIRKVMNERTLRLEIEIAEIRKQINKFKNI